MAQIQQAIMAGYQTGELTESQKVKIIETFDRAKNVREAKLIYATLAESVGKWYEVQALAEDTIFVPDPSKPSDTSNIKVGKYIKSGNRFITEFTPENFMKLTFGGGNTTADDQLASFARTGVTLRVNDYQNNLSLGFIPTPNTTLFIQYRVGGGLESNVGVVLLTCVNVNCWMLVPVLVLKYA